MPVRQRLLRLAPALTFLLLNLFLALSLGGYDPADAPGSGAEPANHSPLLSNPCGPVGATLAHVSFNTWAGRRGCCSWDWPPSTSCSWPGARFPTAWAPLSVLRLVLAVAAGLIHKFAPGLRPSPPVGSGGYIGALVAMFLVSHFGPYGMLLIMVSAGVFGLGSATTCSSSGRSGKLDLGAVPARPSPRRQGPGAAAGRGLHASRGPELAGRDAAGLARSAGSTRPHRRDQRADVGSAARSAHDPAAHCQRPGRPCLPARRARCALSSFRRASCSSPRAFPDPGARGQDPRPGHAAGAHAARFRLPGSRRPDRHRPGDHSVRDRAGGRAAGLEDHEPGRRPGHRAGGAERPDRGADPGQDDRRHRGPQRPPRRGPAGRGDRERGVEFPAECKIPLFLGKDVKGHPWSSTWPRCPTC